MLGLRPGHPAESAALRLEAAVRSLTAQATAAATAGGGGSDGGGSSCGSGCSSDPASHTGHCAENQPYRGHFTSSLAATLIFSFTAGSIVTP
ncbi:hypothetical protein [Paenibacillus naphthalenovorans]|uniref:hypothetical protein n=1 Tax=Paenibacillus naphthalenovorans TaxID=162209 RepID=UPI003D2795E0